MDKKIFLALLAIVLLLGCAPKKTKIQTMQPKPLKFKIKEVSAVVSDKVGTSNTAYLDSRLSKESKEIASLLTNYANKAFLEPKKLSQENIAFAGLFTEELEEEIIDKWDSLSLGNAASLVERLSKNEGEVTRLWIYFDDNLTPLLAALDFNLKATYQLKDNQSVYLKAEGNLVLEPRNRGNWKIISYQINQELKSKDNVDN